MPKIYIVSLFALIFSFLVALIFGTLSIMTLKIISLCIFITVLIIVTITIRAYNNIESLLRIIEYTVSNSMLQRDKQLKLLTEYLEMVTNLQRKIYEFEYCEQFEEYARRVRQKLS